MTTESKIIIKGQSSYINLKINPIYNNCDNVFVRYRKIIKCEIEIQMSETYRKQLNTDEFNLMSELINIDNIKDSTNNIKNTKIEELFKNDKYKMMFKNNNIINFYYWCTSLNLKNLLKMLEILEGERATFRGRIQPILNKDINMIKICEDCNNEIITAICSRSDRDESMRNNYICDSCEKIRDNKYEKESQLRKEAEEQNKIQEKKEKDKLKHMPYKDYLETEHWKITRKKALKRANYKCQLCSSNEELNVHHNTYENRGNEKDEDLIVLCHHCHSKFHDKLDDKIESKENIDNNDTKLLNEILNILHIDKDEAQQYITYKNKINKFEQKIKSSFI
jgi:5-methylcytosine-specific restriction endonuclease McrA